MKFNTISGVAMLAIAMCDLECAAVADTNATSDTDVTALEAVTVTARRVNENLQDVPVAVTVVSGAALQTENVVSVAQLGARVPSLQTSNSSGSRDQVIFSLRGLTETYGGSAPSVVTYFSDVPTFVAGPNLLFDIDNIEVLKGPQGTLFGRNTTGGAILINPQRPQNEFGGYVDFSAGDYGLARAQAALNMPIMDDKLLVRLAVDSNHRSGFTRDLQTNQSLDGIDYTDARISIIARPFAGLENYLVYDQDDSDNHGGGLVLSALAPGSLVTKVAPGITDYYAAQQARGIRTVDYDTGGDFDRVTTRALTDVISYKIAEEVSVKAIYGFRTFKQDFTSDTDATPYPLIQEMPSYNGGPSSGVFGSPGSFKTQTGELQFQGKSFANDLSWTVGAYYEHTTPYSTDQLDDVIQFYSTYLLQGLRYDSSKAIYGQGSYDLSAILPGLTFTSGLRYTEDDRTLLSSSFINGVCNQVAANANCQRRQSAGFSALTYTADIDYKINPNTLVYLTTRKGYKSGGFNASVPTDLPSTFQPETVHDAEIGIKSDFKVGGVDARLNADYYHTQYHNIQLTHNLLDPVNGEVITATGNVADAIIQGVELEGTLIPLAGLEITAFYAFIDPAYNTDGYRSTAFYNVPKDKIGSGAQYAIPIGAAGTVAPGLNYTYQTSSHVSNTPDAYDVQPGYGVLDAHLDWRGVFGSKLDLSAFVNNVTDKVYTVYEINLYKTVGINTSLYSLPRMYGVRAHYSF